jgi:hypothetical protein
MNTATLNPTKILKTLAPNNLIIHDPAKTGYNIQIAGWWDINPYEQAKKILNEHGFNVIIKKIKYGETVSGYRLIITK